MATWHIFPNQSNTKLSMPFSSKSRWRLLPFPERLLLRFQLFLFWLFPLAKCACLAELRSSLLSSLSLGTTLWGASLIFVDFLLFSLALVPFSSPTFSFCLSFLPLGDSFLEASESEIFLSFRSSSFSLFLFLSSCLLSFLDSSLSFSFLSSSLVSSLTFRFSN